MDTSTALAKPEFSMVQKSFHNKTVSKLSHSKSKESSFDSLFTNNTNHDKTKEMVQAAQQKKIISSKSCNTVKKSISINSSPDNKVSKDIQEQVKEMASEMKEKVKDILDLSEEELNGLMEQMGITMFDLLDPSQLLKIILTAGNEEDPGALLTNEVLGNQFKELMDCVNQIRDQYSLNAEELKNLINQMKQEMPSNIQSEDASDESKEFIPQKTDDSIAQSVDESDLKSDEVSISVVKEEPKLSESKSDSKGSSSENMEKKSSFTDQLIEHMVNASNSANQLDFSSRLAEIHETKNMVSQIVDQIKIQIRPDQTSMEFTLNPESLGKVALNVTSRNGVLTASFLTQNQAAKEAIESQMQILKDNLNEQGLKVDAIEVTVSEFGFSQDNQMGQKKEQRNQSFTKEKKVFHMDAGLNTVEDILAEDNKVDNSIHMGSQIDYSA